MVITNWDAKTISTTKNPGGIHFLQRCQTEDLDESTPNVMFFLQASLVQLRKFACKSSEPFLVIKCFVVPRWWREDRTLLSMLRHIIEASESAGNRQERKAAQGEAVGSIRMQLETCEVVRLEFPHIAWQGRVTMRPGWVCWLGQERRLQGNCSTCSKTQTLQVEEHEKAWDTFCPDATEKAWPCWWVNSQT